MRFYSFFARFWVNYPMFILVVDINKCTFRMYFYPNY